MEKVMLDHTGCVRGRCGADVIMRSESNSKGQNALRGEYAVVKNATKFTTSAFPINKNKDCFYNKIGVDEESAEAKKMIKCEKGDKMRTSNFFTTTFTPRPPLPPLPLPPPPPSGFRLRR